jgi:hypothetical protein
MHLTELQVLLNARPLMCPPVAALALDKFWTAEPLAFPQEFPEFRRAQCPAEVFLIKGVEVELFASSSWTTVM